MTRVLSWASRGAGFVAAMLMAAMFATFIVQVAIRYSARIEWIAATFPALDATHFGWTLELCLVLWVWLVFWGNAFVVRERDHVTFDMIRDRVRPGVRKWFAICGALAIAAGLLASLGPTWDRFHILRLKKTATLGALFGDGIRMREIYSVYILFLVVVSGRYLWRAWHVWRHGDGAPGA